MTSRQQFLYRMPDQIEWVGKAYHHWIQARSDSGATEEDQIQAMEMLVNAIAMHDQLFLRSFDHDSLDHPEADEVLEYYDKAVQLNLSWYLNFVENSIWEEIQSQLESQPWRQQFWTETIRNPEDLRKSQRRIYSSILNQVALIPEKLQRKFSERYLIYDEPPYPENGYPHIQDLVSQLGGSAEATETCLIKIDVSATGELLRVAMNSSGDSVIDSALVEIVKAQTWLPATREGEPVRATVQIPIRISRR